MNRFCVVLITDVGTGTNAGRETKFILACSVSAHCVQFCKVSKSGFDLIVVA